MLGCDIFFSLAVFIILECSEMPTAIEAQDGNLPGPLSFIGLGPFL